MHDFETTTMAEVIEQCDSPNCKGCGYKDIKGECILGNPSTWERRIERNSEVAEGQRGLFDGESL
jgi:hypothetical protein